MDPSVFMPPPALPRVLVHIINAALPNAAKEISKPPPLNDNVPCIPIKEGGILRQEGLLDVFGAPNVQIACLCMFKLSGWAQCPLSAKEVLRVFDIPLNMDAILLDSCRERCICGLLPRAITPLVVTSIFCALWTQSGGVGGDIPIIQQQQELTEHALGVVELDAKNRQDESKEKGDIDIGAPAGDMDMDDPLEGTPKGQSEEYTSLPGEEEANIQSDKVLFQWVAQGWSNTTRYEFRIQHEVPQVVTKSSD